MRAQPKLLNALVDYSHPKAKSFMLEGKSLTPTTKDIYFLTGLSRRGEPVNLRSFPPRPHNIARLIGLHYEAGIDKVGSQVSTVTFPRPPTGCGMPPQRNHSCSDTSR
jgi:hypothetical protein